MEGPLLFRWICLYVSELRLILLRFYEHGFSLQPYCHIINLQINFIVAVSVVIYRWCLRWVFHWRWFFQSPYSHLKYVYLQACKSSTRNLGTAMDVLWLVFHQKVHALDVKVLWNPRFKCVVRVCIKNFKRLLPRYSLLQNVNQWGLFSNKQIIHQLCRIY